MADWLRESGVTHPAMESTGVCWKPVWNILEGQFEILLVNAQHIKAVPGRKTDQKDSEWIADLLQHGLLKGRAELRLALEARMTEHHRFLLKQLMNHLRSTEDRIDEVEKEIARRMKPCQDDVDRLVHDSGGGAADGVGLAG